MYLPKLRVEVVLHGAIRDAVAKLDPQFGYADGFDESSKDYRGLIWARAAPDFMPATALLVRHQEVLDQLGRAKSPGPNPVINGGGLGERPGEPPTSPGPKEPSTPKRFWGSVEIDMADRSSPSRRSSTRSSWISRTRPARR